jgi:hypothetical protein
MSDAGSKTQGDGAFGVPNGHFLRLAFDLLQGLELQCRERGQPKLASLIDVAKTEAEDALRIDAERFLESPGETKLLRLVNAIRSQITTAQKGELPAIAAASESRPARKRKTRQIEAKPSLPSAEPASLGIESSGSDEEPPPR